MAIDPPPRITPEEAAFDNAEVRSHEGAHPHTEGEQANELLEGITKLLTERGTSIKVAMVVMSNALIGLARARKLRRGDLKALIDTAWDLHAAEAKKNDKQIIVSHA